MKGLAEQSMRCPPVRNLGSGFTAIITLLMVLSLIASVSFRKNSRCFRLSRFEGLPEQKKTLYTQGRFLLRQTRHRTRTELAHSNPARLLYQAFIGTRRCIYLSAARSPVISASTSAACCSGFTFSYTFAIFPKGSIRKEVRLVPM